MTGLCPVYHVQHILQHAYASAFLTLHSLPVLLAMSTGQHLSAACVRNPFSMSRQTFALFSGWLYMAALPLLNRVIQIRGNPYVFTRFKAPAPHPYESPRSGGCTARRPACFPAVLNLPPRPTYVPFGIRPFHAFRMAQKQRILPIVSVKPAQRHIPVLCFRFHCSRIVEGQRITDGWFFFATETGHGPQC